MRRERPAICLARGSHAPPKPDLRAYVAPLQLWWRRRRSIAVKAGTASGLAAGTDAVGCEARENCKWTQVVHRFPWRM
jgi:hypothetical protein